MHEEETVDLLAYAQRLTRYIVPAAIVGLVVLALVAGIGFIKKPVVHTKAHVLVQPAAMPGSATSPFDSEMLSRTMRTYVALEDLPQLTQLASKKTHGKFTPEQVADQTEVFWGGGSMLLATKAEAENQADAELLSNALADALVEIGPGLLKRQSETVPVMSVVERAKLDDDPLIPKTSRTQGILPGIAAGIIAALLTAVFLEWRASRRRRFAEAEHEHRVHPVTTGATEPTTGVPPLADEYPSPHHRPDVDPRA